MSKAWRLAFEGARYFGGRARQYFPAALKQAWASIRTPAAATAAMRASIQTCVAGLAAEAAEMERLTVEGARRLGLPGYRRAAEVVPFPSRRPVVTAVTAAREAA